MSKTATNIAKARAGLIIDRPFFASLLLPMPISESEEISTFATDGDSIIYNAEFADSLTLEEMTFVLAHETLHCVFDHMGNRGSRCPNKWNIAADYIINDILVNEKIGKMPKMGLYDPALVVKGNGHTEGVYKLLPDSASKKKPGTSGGSLDSVLDAGSDMGTKPVDAATLAQKASDMKVRVIQAKNAAKMQGKLSSGLERLVSEIVKPVVDWREVLRRFVSERAKIDYSFARPKRRFLGEDLYLPSLTGEKMGSLTVAVDCSGSVDDILLAKFAAEINAIKQDAHPSRIEVIYFDSKVLRPAEIFEAEQDVILSPIGGGGTAFSPVFKYINAQSEAPVAVVFLTDLCCNDFGPTPEYPVLWAVLEGNKNLEAPFGEIVEVVDSKE